MHKLDDVLKHYGVRGMKWGTRRDPEQIKEDLQNGVNAAGEALEDAGDEVLGNDSIMEELGDVIDVFFGGKGNMEKETRQLNDAIKDKVEDVSKDLKKRGERMLKNIFGESKPKKTISTFIETPPK